MIKDIVEPAITFVISFVTVFLLHPYLVKIALLKDIVDKPNARRLNHVPIPVLGGVGVFSGFVFALYLCSSIYDVAIPNIYIIVFMTMLGVGLLDDILDFKPISKFLVQIIAITLLMFFCDLKIDNLYGVFGVYELSEYISIPLTLFACVGLINAINLIDGIDGLASGYGIAAAAMFCMFGYYRYNDVNILLSTSIIGALVPFFVYNVFGKQNKMFIGDAGSHLLGIIFCLLVLNVISCNNCIPEYEDNCIIAFCFAVMAHPVMDTLRVMIMRLLSGCSPFKADKTHLHHAIISMGFSHVRTTVIIIALNLTVVAIWYISFIFCLSATLQLAITFCSSLLFIVSPYFIICFLKKNNPEKFEMLCARIKRSNRATEHRSRLHKILSKITFRLRNV